MFETVLGVDPGTAALGLAVLEATATGPRIRCSETLRTPSGLDPGARLRRIHQGVRDAIVAHRPQAVAVERLLWGRNVNSAMQVARASGVVLLAAAEAGVPVQEYAPLEVKMAVTGSGAAPKEAVRRSLERGFRLAGVPAEPNAADAVAVAVCHLQQARVRARAGGRAP